MTDRENMTIKYEKILKALADGKQVRFLSDGKWHDESLEGVCGRISRLFSKKALRPNGA